MDVVDHQIARIGTMFLGMTLDCARCHDHKFDPIDQRDYYAMAGIFANVEVLSGIWRSNVTNVVTAELPEYPAEQKARELATPLHAAEYKAARQKWRATQEALREAESRLGRLVDDDDAAREALLAKVEALRREATETEGDWRFLEFHKPDVPRAHVVVQHANLENVRINIRGNANALGHEVPRGVVPVIGPQQPTIDSSSSGRLELVDWLFAADNPLTARVLANRVWTRLFGRGLVEPVDYFGVAVVTNEPTHPELLDYLAWTLIRQRWSLKTLLREIALSRTYRLSSAPSLESSSIDPENRLLWRANPRRLDAEMIRDSMLWVSGSLQRRNGGPAIPLAERESLAPGDLVNPPTVRGGFEVPQQYRFSRSIYQPVIRSYVHKSLNLIELFDTPSPNEIVGHRVSTTLPTQSLYLLNSPFVKQRAGELVEIIQRDADATDANRLGQLWLRTLGQPIRQDQCDSALVFLETVSDRKQAWARLCHSLLASNEFLFRR